MIIAIFSDIHGNIIALNQCLDFLNTHYSIDKKYFLGDFVGYLPDANAVIDELNSKEYKCLLGNHDAMMLGKINYNSKKDEVYKISNCIDIISDENKIFITSLDSSHIEEIAKQKLLFVHGSPENELKGYVYPDSDFSKLKDVDYDIVFMGHTHYPFVKKIGNTTFVNVGSVGLPRDSGNWQSFAIFDTELMKIEIVRLKLDIKSILEAYGNDIHKSVINVFNRKNVDNLDGEIIML